MKKKKFLTENDRKNKLLEKEKAIIESFSRIFNKIKRIDETQDGEDYEKISREVEYGVNPYQENQEIENDLIEFDVPEWSLSALINGDFSGLNDEDEVKILSFIKKVQNKYGNANFMLGDIENEDDLGFRRSNDIDNLGSNVYRLYIKP